MFICLKNLLLGFENLLRTTEREKFYHSRCINYRGSDPTENDLINK